MGFDAAEAVAPLDYDFRPFSNVHGVIPEPSTGDVEGFFQALRGMAAEVRELMGNAQQMQDGELNDEDAAETISKMDDNMVAKFQDRLIDAIAGLTNGTPSKEEIGALPYRVLGAFSAWLGGELRPNQPGTVTTPSRAVRAVR